MPQLPPIAHAMPYLEQPSSQELGMQPNGAHRAWEALQSENGVSPN